MTASKRLSKALCACATVAQLFTVGCQPVSEATGHSGGVASKAEATGVTFALPAGLVVSVDGKDRGMTPLSVLEVEPGTHIVVVKTPCGAFEADVTVVAGKTTTVTASQFDGLGFAKLKVVATKLDGSTLESTAMLGDWRVPGGAAVEVEVPACKLRLHVQAPDVGGFIEDIEFAVGKRYARDVVLTRGADMVRIHGGKFVTGPPADQLDQWDESDLEILLVHPPYPAEVATFDLDKHEVTTAEFHECRKQEGCVPTGVLLTMSRGPIQELVPLCTTKTYDRERQPLAGKANVSMNCIADWEAEQYCAWVGKRLPNVEEWEFAARDRGADVRWREAFDKCKDYTSPSCEVHVKVGGPGKACSRAWDITEQGVCDVIANVAEITMPTARSGPMRSGGSYWVSQEPFKHNGRTPNKRWPTLGFRCARNVKEAADGD
ncbi:MAG: SUMF1/EgtB/PvdO family nonheme iron enzyme [Nannocystaceae bacterium]|nr:SUMF1/EgtB/PvdO family nonheme iron enzyme [Nannocystaceae bacterium]